MNKERLNRGFGFVSLFLLSLLMGRAADAALARPPVGSPPAPTTLETAVTGAKETPAYKTYTYTGDRYRDPFIPLNGDVRTSDMLDRAPQISALTLKGIVQDANGRMALLTSGVNSYILHGGRLYDGRNRAVKKISGVIKTDSVVLIGSDRTVRELRTKTEL